jgi:formyl-CoA transferase
VTAAGPLHGIRVLEITRGIAGPLAGVFLADLGANVVKLESTAGDDNRHILSVVPGTSKLFQWLHRGKRSIAVDLETEAGRQVLHRLVPSFDVVLTNQRASYAKRLEFDYATLVKLRPDVIYASISAFGLEGPLADAPGVEVPVQAYAGIIVEEGRVDPWGAPRGTGSTWFVDCGTGIAVALGVVAAVLHRRETGEGQEVRGTLLRTAMAMIGEQVTQEPVSDAVLVRPAYERARQLIANGADYQTVIREYTEAMRSIGTVPRPFFAGYMAKDGPVFLGAMRPRHRAAAASLLGIDAEGYEEDSIDLSDPDDFALATRVKDQIINAVGERTVSDLIDAFRAAGIPIAPVLFPMDLANDPQASLFMTSLEDQLSGPQKQLASLFEMSKSQVGAAGPAPVLGSHTDEVLTAVGFTPTEVTALRETGAVL